MKERYSGEGVNALSSPLPSVRLIGGRPVNEKEHSVRFTHEGAGGALANAQHRKFIDADQWIMHRLVGTFCNLERFLKGGGKSEKAHELASASANVDSVLVVKRTLGLVRNV